ncbi:gek [Cordylochernes scorpioides]|uniref:non-specific serine/threonine protein kinase n=1 Tax=Cordylochernes scorpioides TaxID=51811 RepID=A0ABY6KXP2_9ARAC|nr:gek [Cordylochernes scorpioides]
MEFTQGDKKQQQCGVCVQYLLMDYYCGGDLLTLLSKFEDHLPEDMARFYICEMILAVHSIHQGGYIHRDIKLDNVLLDASGHIRLADFGSCLRLLQDGTVQSKVTVGTPDYISPEILRAMEDGHGKYGRECDWWSLGVCMYEILYGVTPFYAESLVETYSKIMNHKRGSCVQNCFIFPDEEGVEISDDAKDLMRRLICSADCRMGQHGIEDFKNHPWFRGVDWDTIRNSPAPYIPEVSSPTDTSNFDVDENDLKTKVRESTPPSCNPIFSGLHLPFVGFTYTFGRDKLVRGGGPELDLMVDQTDSNILNTESTLKLQEEITFYKKKSSELEAELVRLQRNKDLDAGDNRTKELDKTIRFLKAEKEDIYRELVEAQEKLKMQSKELKDALQQRKLAMSEYTEHGGPRLSELRAQKQKLSRQVRDKEEELETAMQKIDMFRQDMRKADKLRRENYLVVWQLEARVDEAMSETQKERRLREHSSEYAHHLKEELESLKGRLRGAPTMSLGSDPTQEMNRDYTECVVRLKADLESVEVQHKEMLIQQQARFTMDMNHLLEQLQATRTSKEMLEKEVSLSVCHTQPWLTLLCPPAQRTEGEAGSAPGGECCHSQQVLEEYRRKQDREKELYIEENRKLSRELERLGEVVLKLQEDRRRLEDDFLQVQEKKESISQWEAQISEIIQWVSDEKDARGYLQALATKMTEELENLKTTGVPPTPTAVCVLCVREAEYQLAVQEKNWRNRRSQKLDKMELLNLQSSLQSEIQAKQAVSEELSRVRADMVAMQNRDFRELQQRLEFARKDNFKKESHIRDLQMKLESVDGYLDRPSSRMSFLDQFLKETGTQPRLTFSDSGGESVEADIEDSVASSGSTTAPKAHQFLVRTFVAPIKCNHCTSLMVGLIRQGAVCEVCGFACHIGCQERVPAVCPIPPDQTKRPVGIDPTRGIGTAYEGYVKVPKLGGVKKGWMRQFVVVCDFKLFLYDMPQDKNAQPYVSQVLDMRDEEFSVSSVLESDVIHANKKDIPCIFRVTTSMLNPPDIKNHTLMLVDKEAEKKKWVDALTELYRILRRNKLPNRMVYQAKELLDNSLSIVKNTLSAFIVDSDRLLLGTEEGLYCVDLDREGERSVCPWLPSSDSVVAEIARIGDGKKVYQIEYIPEEQLILIISVLTDTISLSPQVGVNMFVGSSYEIGSLEHVDMCGGAGKQKHLRLIPVGALDGQDVEWIKVPETKNCSLFACAYVQLPSFTGYLVAVAVKRQVLLYEVTRVKGRHQRHGEISLSHPAATLDMGPQGQLVVGLGSHFNLYNLAGLSSEPLAQLAPDLGGPCPMEPLLAVALPASSEFLLIFSRRSPHSDWCWGGDTALIRVFQTKPLCKEGTLALTLATELPLVVYLHSIQRREDLIRVPSSGTSQQLARGVAGPGNKARAIVGRARRRFSVRGSGTEPPADRRSRLISGPSNFNHISHMGPGQGIQLQKLIDISSATRQRPPAPLPPQCAAFNGAPPPPKPHLAPPTPNSTSSTARELTLLHLLLPSHRNQIMDTDMDIMDLDTQIFAQSSDQNL